MKSFSIIAACTFCVTVTISQGAAAEQPSPVGKTIDDFQLSDYLGSAHQLSDWHDKKAVAIVFLGAECPLARLYAGRLEELAKRYGPRGVQFIGIDANQQDSLEKISQFARAEKIDFPLLKDPASKVADQFGALRTPEAFLLDPNRAVKYWGAIDDQYGVGVVRPKAKKQYLADALDELLAGKPISNPEAQAVGCIIGRVNRKAPTGDVTYSKQIARIFNAHCVECHRPGQVAPFSLTSYDEASAWAETIREVMQAGRMPPWHADPQYGRFRNDARLSEEDKRLVYAWIENGVPEGDRRQLPEAPKFIEGWRIPQPDLVVRMPEAFKVPATGTVPYQYFTVDPGFKEDVWIRAAEGRPGNRAVVHHMIVFYLATGEQQRPEIALTNAVASFVPGMPAHSGPETYGRRIPAGSKLIFQMHYTPNGSEQIDQSEAGFVITDPKKVQTEVTQAAALTWKFQIPPGDADYPVTARYHFTEDVELYTLVPHMHWRGKSFRFTAVYPDQHEEVLLDVPHYDFNWQNAYMLAAPKRLPSGADLVCTAHFDNSVNNPVNPDPTATVMWGDQTWQEMCVGSFSLGRPEQDLRLGPPQVLAADGEKHPVRFRYKPAAEAKSVSLAGDFNQWRIDAQKMDGPDSDGFFSVTLPLAPGKYEYKFVVNGTAWKPDPGNREHAGYYGNSVITVAP